MNNKFEQELKEFINFIQTTTLDGNQKMYFIEVFSRKGYLDENERQELINELNAENAAIDSFIATNLS